MKKITLLFTLTLCAGALNGMEPETWNLLPREAQVLIIQALNTGKNPNETIRAIMAASQTSKALNQIINEEYHGSIKKFTVLVDLLAKKFPNMSREEIVRKFNTPIAQQYIALSNKLGEAVATDLVEKVAQLINQGADVNFLFNNFNMLELAVNNRSENSVKIMKLLIDHGANPYLVAKGTDHLLTDLINEGEFLDHFSVSESESEDYETKQLVFPQFEKLLKEAMAKHQPSLDEENVSGEGK